MATPRTWLNRIDEILAILRASDVECFDRAAIEKLFEIQRRTAILLMGAAGAVKSSDGYFCLDREALIEYVEHIDRTEGQEVSRRQRALSQIDREAEKWRTVRSQVKDPIRFPISDEIAAASFSSLPHGVDIEPGRITVTFDPKAPEDACQKLFAISKAMVNDLGGFVRRMNGKAVSKETAIDDFVAELEQTGR